MSRTDQASLQRAFEAAGLGGRRAVVHSSLRSLGHVQGGAPAVASALRNTLQTLVVPTCCWGEGSPECRPPAGREWRRNGRDPGSWPQHLPVPFDPARTLPVLAMGAIPRAVLRLPGVVRGSHPLVSFAAVGSQADRYAAGQAADAPHFPLEQLERDGGCVVLLGVDLTRCTALHVAEQRSGRQAFVRWALARDGRAQPVRVGGCSEGFERLWPALAPLFRRVQVAEASVRIAPLSDLLERATDELRRDPAAARCHDVECARCRDGLLGGPLPPSEP